MKGFVGNFCIFRRNLYGFFQGKRVVSQTINPYGLIGGASRWAILVLFKSAMVKYGVLRQEGKNGRFYEAKVALDFDL